jgi:2,5-diamino-6-(ribosylamino)-4(3H)-pyrimidinone 5'-phosphate reductase
MKSQKGLRQTSRNAAVRKSQLPFVFLNVATTLDGKIAPTHHKYVRFSSDRDQQLLLELRTKADAVMSGAHTVNSFPMDLGPGGKKYRAMRIKNGLAEYNLRIIVSGSASISPEAEIFKHHFSPVIVLTTEKAPQGKLAKLSSLGAEVKICGKTEIDFVEACRWLRSEWKVRSLLCEGGGEVNWSLLKAGVVDEIYHTLCPVIFGGRAAPTLADGDGAKTLAEAIQIKFKSIKRIGDELFMVHRVRR